MNKEIKLILIFAAMAIFALMPFASAGSYHVNDDLDLNDINVFFSKTITAIEGNYKSTFIEGFANGHLIALAQANDGSYDTLFVKWNSEGNPFGITVTQDDQYALKFTANALVIHNDEAKFNQLVYVHYNKLNGQLVVRGYGFRIATQ